MGSSKEGDWGESYVSVPLRGIGSEKLNLDIEDDSYKYWEFPSPCGE